MMWGPSGGGWWGFWMMLIAVLFLALIVVGVVLIVRSLPEGGGRARGPEGNRALDILDERFARGEIDHNEYEDRRRVLTGGR